MVHTFGTPEWAEAFQQEINRSSEYRNAGAEWGVNFNGNLLFLFVADAAFPETQGLFMRLQGGACQGVEFTSSETHPDAGFVLRAPFSLWKDIFERNAMAATAILTGKLQVVGKKMKLLKYTAAHRALVHCATLVGTHFPGVKA
ncbi:MAG: SCP2 sterol-binding domain-containing protein [Planctomycetota bacterium]